MRVWSPGRISILALGSVLLAVLVITAIRRRQPDGSSRATTRAHRATDVIEVGTTDWPQLRGPLGRGQAPAIGSRGPGVSLQLDWRREIGSGYSGVVTSDERAVTMVAEGEDEYLIALDPTTGEESWRLRTDALHRGRDGGADGPISTPTIAAGVIFALSPKGKLLAVRLADGNQLWSTDLVTLGVEVPEYGFATSPIVVGEAVIMMGSFPDGRSVGAFDRTTGGILWTGGRDRATYQTPAVVSSPDGSVVIAAGDRVVSGLRAASGEELWRYEFSSSAREGFALPIVMASDRFLIDEQHGATAFRLVARGSRERIEELWQSNHFKSSYGIPVYRDGYLYGFSRSILSCIDAATGETLWRSRESGGQGIIAVGDLLVIAGSDGDLVVADASPRGYLERARLHVLSRSGLTWPSASDGRIFVRSLEEVAAVSLVNTTEEQGPSVAVTTPELTADADAGFLAFLRRVERANDKRRVVDEFLGRQDSFPIVEGPDRLHFVYRGAARDVAVVGSMTEVGDGQPLRRLEGTDVFYRSYILDPAARWEYQFVVDFEQIVTDPRNPRLVRYGAMHGPHRERSVATMPGWRRPSHVDEQQGVARGHLDRFLFASERLGNRREIVVYLPHGYQDGRQRYPLLLVNDGPAWLEYGALTNTLDNSIAKREVAPLVVAFIGHADEHWWKELGWSATEPYIQMLVRELIPELDGRYRTLRRAEDRAIMGVQGAGLCAALVVFEYPQVIAKAALQSPGLGSAEGDQLIALVEDESAMRDVQLYLDWSRYDERSAERRIDFREDGRRLAALLRTHGYEFTGGETVDTGSFAGWRSRSDRILAVFFPPS